MEQHAFIGTLELIFHTKDRLFSCPSDAKFQIQILPVAKRISIELKELEELEDCCPYGKTDYVIGGIEIWDKCQGEYRRYITANETDSMIASYYSEDRVTLSVHKQYWETKKNKFRPWFYIHLEQLLLSNRALVLHSASIIYRGTAILFTAPSGTGKTTQTDLWHKYRKGVCDLNGDRTLLQWTPDGWYGCGFPIYGSTVCCEQVAAPIGAIVVIRQSDKDHIKELSTLEKVSFLYSETTVLSTSRENVNRTMDLLELLAEQVKVIQLDCTMQRTAVDILHYEIFGE